MINPSLNKYNVIGLMSGTSLDGVDVVFCEFSFENRKWLFEIVCGETIPYSKDWKQRLIACETASALEFQQTNIDYGFYLGERVRDFVAKHAIQADFVSSHGHTIFHQPDKKLTVQIGAGSAISAACKLPVVCDFRSLDVAMGGQGAPLVPIGDQLLFSDFEYCLNLGGFANISYQYNDERIAFDICPVNIVMNAICAKIGKEFDDNGDLANKGALNDDLLQQLNNLPYYHLPQDKPKSLGKEWVLASINPILSQYAISENSLLRTFCEHVAIQIANVVNSKSTGKLLITGGGAYNSFLIERIQEVVKHEIRVPEKKTIEFKEALIFAFLGVLRMRNEINCLKSVTGASADNCGGAIYG